MQYETAYHYLSCIQYPILFSGNPKVLIYKFIKLLNLKIDTNNYFSEGELEAWIYKFQE